ncbi:MAG: hypothetical protein BGO82_02845 [Devosia sp. 67-54]|uniref:hypothetical protein n=1 Tax=unclassified Devosia TaxID=196773 RepID=UPI0009609AD4|nr:MULTISPECIES: hypothetical protein [unclassified Devosia]MBN9305407.1 hypothetical protein [Devosia sp.]OJX18997.1 MAG: hypothetical protein BGO82_02845 [Devosia sp. 67-54]
MRIALAAFAFIALTAPALAQFPPPGIYSCAGDDGDKLGTLSLLVAGDYQWQAADGMASSGQIASASNSVEALSGPLGDAHWQGSFSTEAGRTTFSFSTDSGKVSCQ